MQVFLAQIWYRGNYGGVRKRCMYVKTASENFQISFLSLPKVDASLILFCCIKYSLTKVGLYSIKIDVLLVIFGYLRMLASNWKIGKHWSSFGSTSFGLKFNCCVLSYWASEHTSVSNYQICIINKVCTEIFLTFLYFLFQLWISSHLSLFKWIWTMKQLKLFKVIDSKLETTVVRTFI